MSGFTVRLELGISLGLMFGGWALVVHSNARLLECAERRLSEWHGAVRNNTLCAWNLQRRYN